MSYTSDLLTSYMYDLKEKHSFALPAFATQVDEIHSLNDIYAIEWQNDSFVLGAGTNTIFTGEFEGHLIVNKLTGSSIIEKEDAYFVTLAAGENWHFWVNQLIEQKIYGLENLALIPGSVGAAPVQNIGAYGVEIAQYIHKVYGVDLRDGQAFSFNNGQCQFSYRNSIFKQPAYASFLITKVEFRLPKQWQPCLEYPDLQVLPDDASAKQIFDHVVTVRQCKLPDPKIVPNAGSFFKNPIINADVWRRLRQRHPDLRYFTVDNKSYKLAAAWLIDQCGLKSLRVGGAGVHQRQALVLVNSNQASGEDLIELAQQVRKQVAARFGVWLEPEVRVLGNQGLIAL